MKKFALALVDATTAIGLGHKEAHRERAVVYFENHISVTATHEGNTVEKKVPIRDITNASAKEKTSPVKNENKKSETSADDLSHALSDLNVALRLDPGDNAALKLRAQVRTALGDHKKAKEDELIIKKLDDELTNSKNAKKNEEKPIDDSGLLCVVCIDAPRDTRLSPCAHSALCGDCAKECRDKLGSCPICNQKIKAIEWGWNFGKTFAPAEAKILLAKMASAVKKAKEFDDDSCSGDDRSDEHNSTCGTMPTLTVPMRGVDSVDTSAERPSTPDQLVSTLSRDFSEYTVGDVMEDDLEISVTPVRSGSGIFEDAIVGFGMTGSPTPMGGIRVDEGDDGSENEQGPDTPPRD